MHPLARACADPGPYFLFNFTLATLVGTFFLFLADINRWIDRIKAESRARAKKQAESEGYAPLGDEDEEAARGGAAAAEDEEGSPKIDLTEMKRELHLVTDRAEVGMRAQAALFPIAVKAALLGSWW